jgi:hypothetical protein
MSVASPQDAAPFGRLRRLTRVEYIQWVARPRSTLRPARLYTFRGTEHLPPMFERGCDVVGTSLCLSPALIAYELRPFVTGQRHDAFATSDEFASARTVLSAGFHPRWRDQQFSLALKADEQGWHQSFLKPARSSLIIGRRLPRVAHARRGTSGRRPASSPCR